MRHYRHALILPVFLTLISTACEPNSSMSVEPPPADSLITTPGVSLHWLISQTDGTIVFVNGVQVDSPAYENLDFNVSDIEAVRVLRDSAAVERVGSIAEGRFVVEYTVKPKQ